MISQVDTNVKGFPTVYFKYGQFIVYKHQSYFLNCHSKTKFMIFCYTMKA